MIRVLVVEDEPLILRNIKAMIEETNSEFCVVGEAYDGLEALENIDRLKPDVVFTDIKMSMMNGLTLVREIRKKNIQCFTVLVSGYKEFEYAKEALQLDVSEYILKPISPKELDILLKSLFEKYNRAVRQKQYMILNALINNKLIVEQVTDIFDRGLRYSFMICCYGPLYLFSSSWITPSEECWLMLDESNLIDNLCKDGIKHWIINGINNNERIIILGSNSTDAEIEQIIFNIHQKLDIYDTKLTTIFDTFNNEIEDIKSFLMLSRIVLSKKLVFGKSMLFNCRDFDFIKSDNKLEIEVNFATTLNLLIKNNHLEAAKKELKHILGLFENNNATQLFLERFLNETVSIFNVDKFVKLNADMEISEIITNSTGYAALYFDLCNLFEDLFSIKNKSEGNKLENATIADDIENYIKENYSNGISLQEISTRFCLTPYYLSKIFKKHKGISINNYIIRLRITEAKRLLDCEEKISLKDMSQTLGFEDPFYFSRVFKDVTGKSPTEYKNR